MEKKMNVSTKTLLGICLVILCLLVATLFLTGCSNSETENSRTVPQPTPDTTVSGQNIADTPIESSIITKETARKIALDHAGVTEDTAQNFKANLDDEDGRQVYEIEFDSDGFEYDYEIDAKTGEILQFDKESR